MGSDRRRSTLAPPGAHGSPLTNDPQELLAYGEIERAVATLAHLEADDSDEALLCWTQIAIERRNLGRAVELLERLVEPDVAAAQVIEGDLLVRQRRYGEHYDLVFAVVRSHRLTNQQLGALAVQTGELAILSANHPLAAELFDFAAGLLIDEPLLNARREMGRRIIVGHSGVVEPGQTATDASTSHPAMAIGALAHAVGGTHASPDLDPAIGEGLPSQTVECFASTSRILREAGLVDLELRTLALLGALSPGLPPVAITPEALAHCPWVTTDLLYHRFEQCPEGEFDYWAEALEHRAESSPHPSLVTETSDVVQWARSIYDQHQQNLALDNAIEQTRSGWRELANLTSNEIRGLLTSLGVAADLRRSGSSTPTGLELALVHRIAALTTMTQLGASEASSEVELPPDDGVQAAALVGQVIGGERPIFDWAQRALAFTNRVTDEVIIHVNPSAMSDMLRWLLLSATTGSLSSASIEIVASTTPIIGTQAGRSGIERSSTDTASTGTASASAGTGGVNASSGLFVIEIRSRTPAPPEPERHRELGLGETTTAYRAAVMLVRSWHGTFSAEYTSAGLDIVIQLPATRVDSGTGTRAR